MRNLKRALSLTLASVMLLGMMVLGTSAASYPDVTDEHNVEAIEVLQAIGVMSGSNSGNFNPDAKVSRIEMAIVMANLLDLDVNYFQGQNTFSDVPDWASGYVNACAANGIVTGVGGGRFGTGNVTATQAALMMLKALGYFQYNSDFGTDWARATANQAARISLFEGLNVRDNTQLTRDQVAKLALNALERTVVEADDNTLHITTGEDAGNLDITGGNVKYVVLASTQSFARAIDDKEYNAGDLAGRGGCTVELGEQLYNGDLKLRDYDADDFERPARNWEYKGQEIGSYMKKGNIRAEYTTGVSARTLYDLIGRANLVDPNYTFSYYVDGQSRLDVINPNAILARTTNDFGTTGKGVLTQVFVDTEKKTIDISSINTWLAKATTDYSSSRESASLEIYHTYNASVPRTDYTTETVSLQDADGIANVKKDDMVLVQRSYKGMNIPQDAAPSAQPATKAVRPAQVVTDATISEYSRGEDNTGTVRNIFTKVTVDETKYDAAKMAKWNADVLDRYNQNLLTDKTYDVYFDQYGYAIGVDLHSGTDNYVFITGADLNGSAIANTTAKANAIFLDGTVSAIDVNVKDTNQNIKNVANATTGTTIAQNYFHQWDSDQSYFSNGSNAKINRWFTYTVNSNNVYTLTPAMRQFTTDVQSDLTIKCSNAALTENAVDQVSSANTDWQPTVNPSTAQRAFGNDKSVYLIADLDTVSAGAGGKVITGVKSLYTGVQSVEIEVKTHADGQPLYQGTPDATTLYNSVYTVYDKDLYIIGSVIIGDSKGSSSNYAYILTAANGEGKRGENYYWTFDAVVDGAKKTLTVESKFANAVNPLKPGNMMELRYNGDYVTDVRPITGDNKFYKLADANITIDTAKETVWDWGHDHSDESLGCANSGSGEPFNTAESRLNKVDLVLEGRTLRIGAKTNTPMLLVDESTPAFVIQKEGTPSNNKTTKEGYGSVSAAIGTMEDANQDATDPNSSGFQFSGRIVAALDSRGLAKWVVFISDTIVPITSGGNRPDKPVEQDTITVKLQYKDAAGANIGTEAVFTEAKAGDVLTIQNLNGYICTSNPSYTYTVPAFVKGQTEMIDTVWFARITGTQVNGAPTPKVEDFNPDNGSNKNDPAKYGVDEVKALPQGAHTLPDTFDPSKCTPVTNPLYFDKTKLKPSDNKMFVFTASGSADYTLLIDNGVAYRETSSFSDSNSHFFFVQVKAGNDGFIHNSDSATGTLKTKGLTVGVHTYQILKGDEIILAGTFEI